MALVDEPCEETRESPCEAFTRKDAEIVIENVSPTIDQGLFAAKCVVGDTVEVEADIFKGGHEVLRAEIKYRLCREREWSVAPMAKGDNDRWRGFFRPTENGRYVFMIQAWVDPLATWSEFMLKKCPANTHVASDLAEGIGFLDRIKSYASGADKKTAQRLADSLRATEGRSEKVLEIVQSKNFRKVSEKYLLKDKLSEHLKIFELVVDRKRAEYGAWYEMFPRSQAKHKGEHGTFRDCVARIPEIKAMGFDVIYLPPIHPIGRTNRKGPNNSLQPREDSPGSCWAIGSEEGGHKSIHPQLGTMEDFQAFLKAAREQGIEIALDLAYQCSPDHPYVRKHPEWFYRLPDGTIRYAENPPKKYEDIYPINFDCENARELWEELRSIVFFWIEAGVKIFRADNPHTKPLQFWQWLIRSVQDQYPEVIFLSEAFTRPKVMNYLAKSGFTQSYTYFTWRNTKWELRQYLEELTQSDMRHYFRGNLFTNTPDILHEYLQKGGPNAFRIRLILAATLSSSYGIYSGFELCENVPLREGSEEYLNSEKYEIRVRSWRQSGNISDSIARINRIRRENPALQAYRNLEFYDTCNDHVLCYGKRTPDNSNVIVVVVNLDPFRPQEDLVTLPVWKFGLPQDAAYRMKDLLTGDKYLWKGQSNYIRLDPQNKVAHLFKLET